MTIRTCLLWLAVAQAATCEYHLTSRPWEPSGLTREQFLPAIEGVCRFTARHQNASGAVIDPFLGREHQYATPYFAYAVGTLADAGAARDLLPAGVRAMEHATSCFAGGRKTIPDDHGEFFIAVLASALPLYREHVPPAQWRAWRDRMRTPTAEVLQGNKNNWETYVMKGDWIRAAAGLMERAAAVAEIEEAWRERHRGRFAAPPWTLYHDRTSNPDTLSVEAVGRGNLLALTALGYDGPSAGEIRETVERATRNTMYLQDPGGQTPANGRTDDHVWVEIGYQLAFEAMAERAAASGDKGLAGQYRRAASLAYRSALRWRRGDGDWAGSFFVTKNRFDPALRVGYQPASQYSNYNGSLMFHLSEAYHARRSAIAERPTPSETGGYAFALDDQFASAFANAGGMYIQANLRGQETETHANYWTPLGVVRFARAGWDGRLGPSDGALNASGGVSFAPALKEAGRWLRVSGLSKRYRAEFAVRLAHPALVRVSITYSPKTGFDGPVFRDDLTVTPDGVLSELRRVGGGGQWAAVWPVIENDGRPLLASYGARMATTAYAAGGDSEHFLALGDGPAIEHGDAVQRSTFGDLRPVRVHPAADVVRTFVYPASKGDPSGEAVRRSFGIVDGGFESTLGRVRGEVYAGRRSAGGMGVRVDLDGDGRDDVTFSERCGFLLRREGRRVTAIEADRDVDAAIGAEKIRLRAWTPVERQ
ncbi:MAG: hypothetical protein R2729_10395 [Bryobacteraceae bacterium]